MKNSMIAQKKGVFTKIVYNQEAILTWKFIKIRKI